MLPSTQFNTMGTTRERLDQWSHLIWEVVGRLDTQVVGDGPFEASAMFGHAGTLQYCQLDSTPHRVERGLAMISRDDRDLIKLVVQQRGRGCFPRAAAKRCWSRDNGRFMTPDAPTASPTLPGCVSW